jgi:DNA repair exonuclease SbcCD ATPase subunit
MKNFLSYGAVPTIINLENPGTTLILGEDLDNTAQGAGANGVGKTVIINALVYALYDKPISNISKDNLVNNINKKNMEVTLDFEKDGKFYQIHRARKTKAGAAGNWVKFTEDGEDLTLDVSATNELIEKVLGMPFELFVRIVAVSANHTPFLDLPVRHASQANQTDIIEELFDLKTLSDKAVALKVEIKETEDSLKIHKVKVDGLEKEHARHEKQIESAEGRVVAWHKSNKNEIAAIKRKLSKITGVDIEDQQAKINERDEQFEITQETKRELNTEDKIIDALDKDDAAEDKKISHFKDDKCYACHQSIKDAKIKIAKAEDQKKDNDKERKASKKRRKAANEKYEAANKRVGELDGLITVDHIDELIEISGKKAALEQELDNKQTANNPFAEPLQELLDVELDPIEMDVINELTETVEHQKFLLKLLTRKDSFVRKALLNKNIPFLNKRLAHYLTELGLPHTVEFTHEMTASISQFSRPLDFGNLSNGQRARVNIALSFAFRDVLQSIHTRVNVCMLDEILDVGLDAIGVTSAAKMLKRKSREENISLYIISHRDEIDSAFDRRMTVQMSKGFSYINEEE